MKVQLRGLLAERRLNEIAELAVQRRRVLGVLVSLTYDADRLIAWRAVEAQGRAAERIADTDPEYVRGHLRRLHWLISEESGSVCLHAPPSMAEIVHRRYDSFADYASIVATLLETMAEEDLVRFRPGILWGIARLGTRVTDAVDPVVGHIVRSLDDADVGTRAMAVWCLVQVGRRDLLVGHPTLSSDDAKAEVYRHGMVEAVRVRDLL